MNNMTGGISLALIGFFLAFINYKKLSFFWDFFNTVLLRKYLGDAVTSIILYIVSIVLIVTGLLLAIGVIY